MEEEHRQLMRQVLRPEGFAETLLAMPPDPVPVIDGLLAATALERDLTLVTRNTFDFERTGVALVDPFASPDPGS